MNNIEEIKYQIPDIDSFELPEFLNYSELKDLVKTPQFRTECHELGLDTPIKYLYRGRTGYLRVQKFLLSCQPVEQVMIQVGEDRSYLIHPDYRDTAIEVEKEVLEEQGNTEEVSAVRVMVSEFQMELNVEEYFIW